MAVRIEPDLPTLVADPARLELVLLNLVANAIKYSDPQKADSFVEVARARRQVDAATDADAVTGSLVDQLGVRDPTEGVALRATFVVDPDNVIQHVSVNNLNVGRNPDEILRVLDGLQTDELCPCNRAVGAATL